MLIMDCAFRIKLNGQLHEFNSEEELNSFLRENRRTLSSQLLSDKVLFSNDRSYQQQIYQELRERSNLVNYKDEDHSYSVIDRETGKVVSLTPVTKILSKEESEKRFGMEIIRPFNLENWQAKAYADMMKAVNPDGTPRYTQQQALDILQKQIKSWQTQTLLGTSWHTIAQQFFNGNITESRDIIQLFPELTGLTSHVLNKYIDELKKFKASLDLKYPNALYATEIRTFDIKAKIAGTMDLVVVDELGKQHIYDYKTSIKNENEWGKDKIKSNNYQLMFYRQIQRRAGYDVQSTHILPVLLKDIDYNTNTIYDFDIGQDSNRQFRETDPEMQNVKKIMPYTVDTRGIVDNANVHKFMKETFNFEQKKTVQGSKSVDDEYDNMLAHSKSPTAKLWYYHPYNANNTSYPISKELPVNEIKAEIARVLKDWENENSTLPERMGTFINDAKKVIQDGGGYEDVKWSNFTTKNTKADNDTILKAKSLLHKYINDPLWQVVKSDPAADLNILQIEHTGTNEVDFIALSSSDLNAAPELVVKGATTVLGNFLSDTKAKSIVGIHKVTNGDVELLKVYSFIKDNKSSFIDKNIGSIKAINIMEGNLIGNEKMQMLGQLETWYNALRKQIDPNLGLPKNDWLPKQLDPTRALITRMSELLTDKRWTSITSNITKTKGILDRLGNLTYADINERRKLLGEMSEMLRGYVGNNTKVLGAVEYRDIERCLELAGQSLIELERLDIWHERDVAVLGNIIGSNNTLMGTPNLAQHPLQTATVQVVNRAMSDARSAFLEFLNKSGGWRDTLDKFYTKSSTTFQIKAVGYNYPAWEKLIDTDNMRFKDVNDPKSNLADFQKQTITTILNQINTIRTNKMLESGRNQDYVDNFLLSEESRNIPLLNASLLSSFKGRNLSQFIDGVYRDILNPNNFLKNDTKSKDAMRTQNEMFNGFNISDLDLDTRQQKVDEAKKGDFETDIELVFSTYMMAHHREEQYNKYLPVLNALKDVGMISTVLGYNDTTNVTKWQNDFIQTTLFGASLIAGESETLAAVTNTIRNISSNATMLLNWGAGATEMSTGFFANIVTLMANKYSEFNFGLKDYLQAHAIVGGTMNQNKMTYVSPGFSDALNEIYGLAHMDVSQMVHQTQQGVGGGIHFISRIGRWFTTFPGWYNRMLIFNSQAIKDGTITLDSTGQISKDSAHQMINDRLVYNEKLDKRFSLYTNNKAMPDSRKTEEYKKQEALYKVIRQELESEPGGIKEGDGTLARAYTSRQATAMRTFANDIHGNYDAVDRSTFDKTAFGRIFLQFKGWLTVKKNRWFTETDTNNQTRGHFQEVLDDEGKVKIGEDGLPIMEWKGKYMEGIAQTIFAMYHELETNKFNVVKSWNNMNATQKANFAYLLGDTLVLGVIMSIIAAFSEPNMAKDNPLGYRAVSALRNSSRDFFICSTVTAVSGPDNPLSSIAWSQKVLTDTWKVASGSKSPDAILKNLSIYRTINGLSTIH